MVLNWNGLRLSAGAAAMAFALVASVPASANIYKFTFSDQGTEVGSFNIDSTPLSSFTDGSYYYGEYSNVLGSGTGFFKTNYTQFWSDPSSNGFFVYSDGGNPEMNGGTSSYGETLGNDYSYFGGMVGANFIADTNVSGSALDMFVPGTYSFYPYYSGSYPSDQVLPQNLSLTIGPVGPAAPAPLAGGGILAGLVSLLGFGFTRFGRRRQALA